MLAAEVPPFRLAQVSEAIAARMGLHFPPERWPDLKRGLAGAAEEFGLPDVAACVESLLEAALTKEQLHVLAGHLTVGETYFFRDAKIFDALTEKVLPALIQARRTGERRLRIWSAACCTGEEPYSLAILLQRLIPDWANWNLTLLATDINERFLQKAAAGVYGEWSFRETPPAFRDRYFQRTEEGRYAIRPEVKQLVNFAQLNLVEDVFPSLTTDTNAMDLIFCRNVLMYFTPSQVNKVVKNLRHTLMENGWLVVSPSEVSQALFSKFNPVNFPGAILYQKSPPKERPIAWSPPPAMVVVETPVFEPPAPWTPPAEEPPPRVERIEPPTAPTPLAAAAAAYAEGRYAEAGETLLAAVAAVGAASLEMFPLLARALANQGRLTEARAWCERWMAADKLDPAAQYLHSMVLQELGEPEPARRALQKAVYLDPDFVLGHFALGNLARDFGRPAEMDKHFANALGILRRKSPAEVLPESDGLTAARLAEIISSLAALPAQP